MFRLDFSTNGLIFNYFDSFLVIYGDIKVSQKP